MPVITVIGSLNVDMVTVTQRIPRGGETVLAKSFTSGWGGKGANQAVAAARLCDKSSTLVRMIGAVGDDAFSSALLKSLEEDSIDVSGVRKVEGMSTGAATVLVEEETGENRILVTPGANATLKWNEDLVGSQGYGDVAIFQLETPMKVVLAHTAKAHAAGAKVILNPAPAAKLPDTAYRNINTLIVNSNEAELLCDMRPDSLAYSSAAVLTSACELLIRKGVKTVIITLGSQGAVYYTESGLRSRQNGILLPAVPCDVVDTTAAGDTFVGAYAVCVAAGITEELRTEDEVVRHAVEFAILASAKTVQKRGAQSAIPYLEDVIPG